MARACEIKLSDEERGQLESWVHKTTSEQRMVQRARIVLESAAGRQSKEIALMLKVRQATVSKWRTRFHRDRLAGLDDAPRPGKTAKYDKTTEKRILAQLDAPPRLAMPLGRAVW